MPRLILSLAVLALAVPLVSGCGDGDTRPAVGFVTNNSYEFWTFAEKGATKAAEEFDVRLEFHKPQVGTADEQRQIIEDLRAKGITGFAISPNDAANQEEFLAELNQEMAVVTQDSDIPNPEGRRCYIGTDNYKAGRAAGKLVKHAFPNGCKVMIFVGGLEKQNAIERRQGVMDELAGEKDAKGPQLGTYELLGTHTDESRAENCLQICATEVAKAKAHIGNLCLVGLWAYNPPAMLGGIKEAATDLKDPSIVDKIPVVAFDEDTETLQGVKDGRVVGTIVQQPYRFGYEAIRILAGLAKEDKSVLPAGGILYIPHRVIVNDKSKTSVEGEEVLDAADFEKELAKLRG